MSSGEPPIRHPDAETLAALAEGRLDPPKLDATLEHVEGCRSCHAELELAVAVHGREGTGSASPQRGWWLAAAAAIAVIAIGAPLLWQRASRPRTPAIADLVALAPRSARLVEPRLSGGFAWAPYRGAMRAGAAKEPARLRIGGVAADAVERADGDASATAQHVAGVAVLLADDADGAIERLQIAGQRAPNDARIASDLAASLYTAAQDTGRASLYPAALAAADQALRADPLLPEALFNRALLLERLGLAKEARRAWERYLAVDASSPWAEEARRRMAALPVTTSDAAFRDEMPRLERASQNGDRGTVAQIVRRYPLQSRTFAEGEYLGRWGEAALRGDAAEAARLLGVARAVGTSLEHESLLRDAVQAIDRATVSAAASLARGHHLYRRGRMAYSRQQLADAERDLAASVTSFEGGRSPMAYVARYYVACALYDRTEVPRARDILEELERETAAYDGYSALHAQALWQLALCAAYDSDWILTTALLTDAEARFARAGERGHLGFVRALLATALMSIGRPDEAWAARIRAFEDLSVEGRGNRLLVALGAAARMEQFVGRRDTARALLAVEIEQARGEANEFILPDALRRGAMLAEEEGDHGTAVRLVKEASVAAGRIAEASLRDLAMAHASAAEGVVGLRDDPRRAIESLSRAIDFYRRAEMPIFLPGAYLHRARAQLRLGRQAEALRDLESGIAEVERRPVESSGVLSAAAFDAADFLFEDAIWLTMARGEPATAFAYAERRRAHTTFHGRALHPPALTDLQRRLRGSGTLVLHLASLPGEIVAFAIVENGMTVTRTPFPRARIGQASPAELFDVLIRPSGPMLARATALIVVADPHLERVPFAALYDRQGRNHLVERISVAVTPSAAALEAAESAPPRTVVAVALPSGDDAASRSLPGAQREIGAIAPLYAEARVVSASEATWTSLQGALERGGVVHIAGHTTRERDDTALRLAGGERLSWARIASRPIHRRTVIVLAACETLRASPAPHARSLSLGAAFVAAGAESAIGTLHPIPDAEAEQLFLAIHRRLAAGVPPAEALRRTQRDAIAGGRLPSWASLAIVTRAIPTHAKGAAPWARS